MLTLLFIALAGAVGALVRLHLGAFVHSSVHNALHAEKSFPFGTLFVNILGCLLLGIAMGLAKEQYISVQAALIFTSGFCGSLTTFSTFAVDTNRFLRNGDVVHASMNVLLSFFAGVGAGWIGITLMVR